MVAVANESVGYRVVGMFGQITHRALNAVRSDSLLMDPPVKPGDLFYSSGASQFSSR